MKVVDAEDRERRQRFEEQLRVFVAAGRGLARVWGDVQADDGIVDSEKARALLPMSFDEWIESFAGIADVEDPEPVELLRERMDEQGAVYRIVRYPVASRPYSLEVAPINQDGTLDEFQPIGGGPGMPSDEFWTYDALRNCLDEIRRLPKPQGEDDGLDAFFGCVERWQEVDETAHKAAEVMAKAKGGWDR